MNQENTGGVRCHDADACAMGQLPCPTPKFCGCAEPECAVKYGTHKPAEAVHQIAEPEPAAIYYADLLENGEWINYATRAESAAELRRQHARIAELESQLAAIGAGGVEPLRKPAAAPQAAMPSIRIDYKQADDLLDMFGGEPGVVSVGVGHGHSGHGLYAMWEAVPDGTVYLGETDDEAMPAHPAEGVPANNWLAKELADMLESTCNGLESYRNTAPWTDADEDHLVECRALLVRATQAAKQGGA